MTETRPIDLYFSPTANGQRVLLALRMMGLPHRVITVDRAGGETRSPAFLAINPAGAVPVIVTEEGGAPLVLAQSGAILIWLAETSGRFLPAAGRERAEALVWLMQVLTDVNPAASFAFLARNGLIDGITPDAVAFTRRRLAGFMGVCDRRLAVTEWLAGEVGLADIALYPLIVGNWSVMEVPAAFPHLASWARRMANLPGVADTLALPEGAG